MWGLMNAGDSPAGSEAGDGIQWVQEKLPQTGKNTIIATIMIMIININVIASVEEPPDLPPWLLPRHPKHQLRFHRIQQFNFCLLYSHVLHLHCHLWRCPEASPWSSSSNILCFSFSQRPVPCHGRRGKRGSNRSLLSLMKRICVLQHDFKAELGVRAAVIVWETQGWTQVTRSSSTRPRAGPGFCFSLSDHRHPG